MIHSDTSAFASNYNSHNRFSISDFQNLKNIESLKTHYFQGFLSMELTGIEPVSEASSIKASPTTVSVLTFPRPYAH